MKKLILVLTLLIPVNVYAQTAPSTPCVPNQGSLTYNTTQVTFWVCATDGLSWSTVTPQYSIPSGLITLKTSGTCGTGWTEVSALNGVMLRGTVAASGNVGQTGGNDTITPTVNTLTAAAQIFSGGSNTTSAVSAGTPTGTNSTGTVTPLGSVSTPTISWPIGVPTNANESSHTHTLTPLGTNAATATSGNCAATNIAAGTGSATACKATAPNLTIPAETFTGSSTTTAGGSAHTHTISWPAGVPTNSSPTFTGSSSVTSAQTFTGSPLGTHTHTVTPTGTNGTSAVTGTLNSFDNRPAYMNVIFCSKN